MRAPRLLKVKMALAVSTLVHSSRPSTDEAVSGVHRGGLRGRVGRGGVGQRGGGLRCLRAVDAVEPQGLDALERIVIGLPPELVGLAGLVDPIEAYQYEKYQD